MAPTIAQSALDYLQGIKDRYENEGVSEIGSKLLTSVFERVGSLQHHPDLGRIVPEFNLIHIRELIMPPFRIVYVREGKTITVVRVWRSERLLHRDHFVDVNKMIDRDVANA